MKAIAFQSPVDLLADSYQEHLIHVAGLQPSTCQKWTLFVRLFLKAQYKPRARKLQFGQLEPMVLLNFVLQRGEHSPPGQLQSLASASRSFCRYLCARGHHPRDLSAALPSISGSHREHLPRYLNGTQLTQLLKSFDRRTSLGKRDYAITLCLARLRLRAGEVARLRLEDVDWRNGRLRLAAPKGRRERHLPLPEKVGQALAAYLRNAPPQGLTRMLFRTHRAQRPLISDWLSERVGTALARAGLGAAGKGAHLLRRSFATQLVQQGVGLKAVADLLGHASLSTTQVYAKVNRPMLRAVAQPWPEEVRP